LVWKAQEIYCALCVEKSAQYDEVKKAILKAYELVPEAYRQKFRDSRKQEGQTYVEFAREKEVLLDRWCAAKQVDHDYHKLRQLILVEEFKTCLPSDVKMYNRLTESRQLASSSCTSGRILLDSQDCVSIQVQTVWSWFGA